jgi:ribonuclease I
MLYNYYYLAIQNWCSVENQIHGLWPDISQTSYPSFCDGPQFNLTELQESPQYDTLAKVWTDCSYDETISLYEHEWSKHGTCVFAETGIGQNEYFETALTLFEQSPNGGCFDLQFKPFECSTWVPKGQAPTARR